MTLQIIKSPKQVNLTGNPIQIEIENTDGLILTPGVFSVHSFHPTTKANSMDTFTLHFNNIALPFIFVANPDDSTTQLPLPDSMTPIEYATAIKDIFVKNYYISKYFDLSLNGDLIVFTSNKIGTNYDITLTVSNTYPTIVNDTQGANPVFKEDYQILLQTYLYISGVKTLINEDLLTTDIENRCSFNITDYLKPFIKSEFSYPEIPNIDLLTKNANSTVSFQFVIAEKYNDVIRSLTPLDDIYYALGGGISTEDLKFYNTHDTNYFDFAENKYKYLSWQPNEKIISKTQVEKLFLFTFEHTQLNISCKIYYADQSEHSFMISDGVNVDSFSVYELICGYKSLELDSFFPAKTISKYEIITIADDVNTFENKTYYIDRTIHANEKVFLFRNSLNNWDSLRCTGERLNTLLINRQSANVLSDLLGTEIRDISVSYDQQFKANTGWTDHLCLDTKAYYNYLREFLISKEVYELKGDILVPIKLTSKKAALHNNKEFVYSLSFAYTYTSKDEFFSDEIGIEDIQYLIDNNGDQITDDNGTPLFE